MGMTMTQKILAAAAGLPEVKAGQLIEADLDLVLGNDITAPVAIHEMDKFTAEGVFHKDKIALCQIKTSSLLSTANVSGNLPANTKSAIILTWGKWELNMPFCQRKALPWQET